MRSVFIYALTEPDSEEIRYIGKAFDVQSRLKAHLGEKGRTRRHNWLKHLAAQSKKPRSKIIEECNEGNWQDRERYWIAYFRKEGFDLTNLTDGGDGVLGYVCTPEHRAKLSIARKGRTGWNKGIPHTEETKAKIRANSKPNRGTFAFGHVISVETRLKMSASHKGKPCAWNIGPKDEAFRKHRREYMLGRRLRLGKKHSQETRQKMSESQKRRYAKIES